MPRFEPRQRKHKVRAREQAASNQSSTVDPNAEQLVPVPKAEREAKKQILREEIRAQHPRISSKKQKRLDKYIENKFKKDEKLDLLRKLEQEKEKSDLRLAALPGNISRKRNFEEYMTGAKPEKAGKASTKHIAEAYEESDADSEDSFETENVSAFSTVEEKSRSIDPIDLRGSAQHGGGLAQPLVLGEDGLPIIQARTSKKRRKKSLGVGHSQSMEDIPWEGFDSEPNDANNQTTDDEVSAAVNEDSLIDSSDEGDFSDGIESNNMNLDEYSSQDDHTASEDESESSISDASEDNAPRIRVSAFKAWATQQLNQSIGHTPSYETANAEAFHTPATQQIRNQLINPILAGPITAPENATNRKAYTVTIERSESVQDARSKLPIVQREQEIMEAIYNHPVVIIKGDTGSGKTTQVPQFLFEAGYGSPDGPTTGLIGVTQPRRVAAVSMSKRVAEELGNHGGKVSHQVRFDSTVSPSTAIKFMTDGILLRELSQDLLLQKYSVIVIDEAHERSVNTDLLIGMLSRIVPARSRKTQFNPNPTPLKLIIMSATLNIENFLHDKLFSADARPPIVEAEGRQHRVTTHFALRSRADYVDEMTEKVTKAHRKLPNGGILAFLTGQNEIRQVSDRLKRALSGRSTASPISNPARVRIPASEVPLEEEDMEIEEFDVTNSHDDFDDIDILTQPDDESEDKEFEISDDEEQSQESSLPKINGRDSGKEPYTSVHVLPLYSQLPTKEQLRVFEAPPDGSRLIVLATNVAETSLTIPGIRYVFDSGRSKERKYNMDTGVQSFEIDYISKASAQQRAGRAGRTGPGHCWRLYTSAVYEQFFPDHGKPEILRMPAENVVLQLKSFGYRKPVTEFPFPSPPPAQALNKAEKLLRNLGALDFTGNVTGLGKELSVYPLSPRLGRILVRGVQNPAILAQVISLVAGLALGEIFVNESQIDMTPQGRTEGEVYTQNDQEEDDAREKRRQEYGRIRATLSQQDRSSDAMKVFTAVCMYAAAADKNQFCEDHFIRPKAMLEVIQLQRQLFGIVHANNPALIEPVQTDTVKHSSKQVKQLNLMAASGYIDQVAIRADLSPNPPVMPNKPRRAIDMPYLPLIPLTDSTSASVLERAIFIHPSSVLSRTAIRDLPQYIVYSHLQQSQAHTVGGDVVTKKRMFPLAPIQAQDLVELARDTALLQYGKPVPKANIEDVRGTPKRRICWVLTELKGGPGFGWPLPPTKVRQVMDVKAPTGWRVEEVLM